MLLPKKLRFWLFDRLSVKTMRYVTSVPRREAEGKPPLVLDSRPPKRPVRDFLSEETRFRMVERTDPERYKRLMAASQEQAQRNFAIYQQLAGIAVPVDRDETPEASPAAG